MGRDYFTKTELTGGTSNSLDGINGDNLIDGDICFTYISSSSTSQEFKYEHRLDDDLAAAEASPYYINPDTNAGNKSWVLQSAIVQSLISGVTKSGSYTVTGTDNFTDIFTSGGVTITLPSAAIPRRIRVFKTDSNLTISAVTPVGGDRIEDRSGINAMVQLHNKYDSLTLTTYSGSTIWYEV